MSTQGVLVFDETDAPEATLQETENSFVIFDPDVEGGEVQTEALTEFLLVEPAKVITAILAPEYNEVVVITPGGPPGTPGTSGPQGPPGPPGQDSAGAYFETFNFATPSQVWTIVHNKNSYALNVETVDTSGELIEGNVQFVDLNTIEIDWYYPTAGMARVFR